MNFVLDKNKKPFIVALTKVGNNYKIKNIIKIAYHKGLNFIQDNINDGRLLYDKSNPTKFRQHRASIAQAKTLSDNNIITDNDENFNPKQENKGSYSPKENLIEFFKNADSSTSVHEVGHWILNTWNKYAPQSKEIESDVNYSQNVVDNAIKILRGTKNSQSFEDAYNEHLDNIADNHKYAQDKLKEYEEKFNKITSADELNNSLINSFYEIGDAVELIAEDLIESYNKNIQRINKIKIIALNSPE